MSWKPADLCVLAAAAALLVAAPAVSAGQVISQLEDPEDPSTEAFVDIVAAWIEQDGGYLTFTIETRGDIPTTLPHPEDSLTYLWLVDADNDPGTGQPHGEVGSEFNVRAVISEVYGGGFVDVTGGLPGGGLGTVVVEANRIEITIFLPQIAAPEQFHWRCAAGHVENGVCISSNPETVVAVANTLPYTPPARVAISTPLLMLSPAGPASGQLELEIRDAAGNLLPVGDYHLRFESSNEAVASVDDSGLVTVHSIDDQPYVLAWADGVSPDNAAVIRSTSTDLGVVHQTYAGDNVAFYLPAIIEDVDLEAITSEHQVVQATDLAYLAQQAGVGATPFGGGRQYYVLDVGDDPATVPCGISGNPIRLGWVFGTPAHNNCYVVDALNNPVPQWFVMFHEMGHNFTYASYGFSQFCAGPSTPHNTAYIEGLASLGALWSWHVITTHPTGLDALVIDDIDAHLTGYMSYFRQGLAVYQNTGANYADLNPDIVDGILCEMYDDYGAPAWFGLYSTFLPPGEPLPYVLDTEAKQATWFVAALSASAGEDLRGIFSSSYGFPIDNAAWPEILACVEARITARPYPHTLGDLNCDGAINGFDIDAFVLALQGPDFYDPVYPDCDHMNADVNRDGEVNGFDIDAFVELLIGG
ncbi:MAG: hypothetical protein KKB50_22285 [Planctomycetes bacterium]|nr:hypothetical protein [Planctomycetota bacterium]